VNKDKKQGSHPQTLPPLTRIRSTGLPRPTRSDLRQLLTDPDYLAWQRMRTTSLRKPEEGFILDEKDGFYYPEHLAQPHNASPELLRPDAGPELGTEPRSFPPPFTGRELLASFPRCVGFFVPGSCGKHHHAKAIICGREWCPDCGRPDSMLHRRRIHAWWEKYQSLGKVGYAVITVPEELRNEFKDPAPLRRFRNYVKRKFQRLGYSRGFIRYHWCGDCPECKGKGCELCYFTGAGDVFKPHLNVLIEEGYIDPKILDKFKKELSAWFKREFKLSSSPLPVLNYQYIREDDPAYHEKKTHRLKYVVRPTWRIYSHETEIIKGFRAASAWGKWNDPAQLQQGSQVTPEIVYAAGCCPKCLKETGERVKITWEKIITRGAFEKRLPLYTHEGDGYFTRHIDIKPPPDQ
jgi:hypothetical protein